MLTLGVDTVVTARDVRRVGDVGAHGWVDGVGPAVRPGRCNVSTADREGVGVGEGQVAELVGGDRASTATFGEVDVLDTLDPSTLGGGGVPTVARRELGTPVVVGTVGGAPLAVDQVVPTGVGLLRRDRAGLDHGTGVGDPPTVNVLVPETLLVSQTGGLIPGCWVGGDLGAGPTVEGCGDGDTGSGDDVQDRGVQGCGEHDLVRRDVVGPFAPGPEHVGLYPRVDDGDDHEDDDRDETQISPIVPEGCPSP